MKRIKQTLQAFVQDMWNGQRDSLSLEEGIRKLVSSLKEATGASGISVHFRIDTVNETAVKCIRFPEDAEFPEGNEGFSEHTAVSAGRIDYDSGYSGLILFPESAESFQYLFFLFPPGVYPDVKGAESLEILAQGFEFSIQKLMLEKKFHKLNMEFDSLISSNPDGMLILDQDGTVLYANDSALKLLGLAGESAVGMPIGIPAGKDGRTEVQIGSNGESKLVELLYRNSSWKGQPVKLVSLRDITELHRYQQQLIRAEKLSAVGTLAAGVAHEFNNILQISKLSIESMKTEIENAAPDLSEKLLAGLEKLDFIIERGKAVAGNMLIFSKREREESEMIDLKGVVENVQNLLGESFRLENIEFLREYRNDLMVAGNRGQLEQAILNLLINARQALAETEGRDKTIRLSIIDQEGEVTFTVADNGCGMDEHTRKNIFIPFFSTKGVYSRKEKTLNGTGLGLAIVYTIVKRHQGRIEVRSQEGKGTEIQLTLPGVISAEVTAPEPESVHDSPAATKDKRILVIDDEEMITDLFSEMLSLRGYSFVKICNSGLDAIEQLKRERFDLIFMDMMMPGITGRELLIKIHEISPEIPVVIVSGKVDQDCEGLDDLGVVCAIAKPFRFEEITGAIENLCR